MALSLRFCSALSEYINALHHRFFFCLVSIYPRSISDMTDALRQRPSMISVHHCCINPYHIAPNRVAYNRLKKRKKYASNGFQKQPTALKSHQRTTTMKPSMLDHTNSATDLAKDPTYYSLTTYIWVFGLAMLGGLVNFMRKIQMGHSRAFNIVELIGELVTSAFAGILTFWLCENSGLSPLLTAALVGISGHMGSRSLFMMEDWMKKRFPLETEKRHENTGD
jgi:hypothetical protein